jgi:hypothetical protein
MGMGIEEVIVYSIIMLSCTMGIYIIAKNSQKK